MASNFIEELEKRLRAENASKHLQYIKKTAKVNGDEHTEITLPIAFPKGVKVF